LRNSPQYQSAPAPAAEDRGLTRSSPAPLLPLPLPLEDAPLRTDGAGLPASTRFLFSEQGSAAHARPKLLPGRFRCGIASFSLSRVRSFFCSCAHGNQITSG